ncbi:enoyl-CoA hydratase/isomerase family protein [Rummeliibacillus sp. JY-2-4R]
MTSLVEVTVKNNIGQIKMNRPNKLNALSKPLVAEISLALDELSKDEQVKVIILSGEGKSFSAGGDIESISKMENPYDAINWIDYVSGLSQKMMDLDKYIIAAVHGYAAGAGFSLALAADFIIADCDAKFALSFTNIGLIPDLGLIKLLSQRVSPPIAKEWISSGKVISAEEALSKGIINRITTQQPVLDEANKFAEFIVKGPEVSNKYVKYLVNHVNELHKEVAFKQENMIQAMLLQTEDHKEGIASFFEKREPNFKGR